MEPIAIEMDIIINIIITVMAALSGRKRRQQVHIGYAHNWRFVTNKLTNMLHHARKRDAKI